MADSRERDLVLAPNEYAYISDQTKGHVIAYVGPYKTSLANTDRPVIFNEATKRFENANLDQAICTFASSPEGWYIVLKNPGKNAEHPQQGTANSLPELHVGRKVNLPGPAFFALWPGQMSKVIAGHQLRSNQYLLVRVYDEEQARENWQKAVVKPQKPDSEDETVTSPLPEEELPDLTIGREIVIKGTSVSFYIPPTGIEVIPDENTGSYVREAVTLERLEYCILLDESGNKRYIKGPAVVFPEPTEEFVRKNGKRKFRAIELNEISGIYIKVIAPYEENGRRYRVGEELFITGKEQMIYFPRPEHALIRYGEQEIYYAVAIPAGEGRYFLDRKTGKIHLEKGPAMFLPDPREAVIVRRVLSQKQVELWYPGNQEAAAYNLQLQEVLKLNKKGKQDDFLTEGELSNTLQEQEEAMPFKRVRKAKDKPVLGDEFSRSQGFTEPRTITLDDKFGGAVTVGVWTGYAVQVVSKTGERKVITGPQTYLLEYDENLQTIELSTGTPKVDAPLLRTVYLRVLHNKVSDVVEVMTKDYCPLSIELSFRVNFTGDPSRWFDVENYVKFLTDHMRSVIRNAVQKMSVMEFFPNAISLLRDIVLGEVNDKKRRPGRLFEENGMHIYDLEVFEVTLEDEELETLIFRAQHANVKQKLALEQKHRELNFVRESEHTDQEIARAKAETQRQKLELHIEEVRKQLELNLERIGSEAQARLRTLEGQLAEQENMGQIQQSELARDRARQELQIQFREEELTQHIREIQAEVEAVARKAEAVSPDLVAALQAFSDRALAEKMAQTMAPLAILGGDSIAEVFARLLQNTPLEGALSALQKKEEE